MTRSALPRCGELVGVERVGDLVALEHRELEQVVGRSGCQCRILLGRQRGETVPGLRCDNDPCAAPSDHPGELLEHDGGPVQIDRKDGLDWRLTR
jgi:hypothetical protein